MASAAASDSSSRIPPDRLNLYVELADNLGKQFVVGTAAERSIQVHQMDPLGAIALPAQRGIHR
ncbi:hypothetical protein I917_11300 [Mycobacterium tuberculosis str. Haarlem/NITR202]|uniref:Uncharacterized protein n=1 Tax=Mycobacterium tuberculosis str. Haarlem/NITR202 TaxID=1304279 RepID=R4LV08_MYCTX|nr:hypothetical protein I917_11300 [Mycobacterium tuberculosis str. Haarlem/NITR202]